MPIFHVIDDETVLCELAVELIATAGFEAVSYTNPLDYLHYLNSRDYTVPDAIFTDIEMPGMNGYELIDKIRSRFPDMKIVVISGYCGVEAFKRNVWHFLPKPYMPEQIIAIATAIVQYTSEESQASSLSRFLAVFIGAFLQVKFANHMILSFRVCTLSHRILRLTVRNQLFKNRKQLFDLP